MRPQIAVPEHGRLAANILHFARALRAAGLPVGSGRVVEAVYCPEGGFQRPVAIKIVHPSLARNETFINGFRAEAALSSWLGHPNIVAALDFGRVDDTYFFARGSIDNKFGVAQITSTFIRLKNEGFVPNRDLIIVFSGDEESSMASTEILAYERPDIAEAEFALNSDSGGGQLSEDGKILSYLVQTSEKIYVTWEITARNPGGHSSRPRPDNAIYDLADAISKIRTLKFPVRWNDTTLGYFEETGNQLGGELGDAMLQFSKDPQNEAAAERLSTESSYVGTTRTTCVPTMLSGGHAENALPQSATVTVNCRVFPGHPVAEVKASLQQVVGNDALEFFVTYPPTESPVSELREDIRAAASDAIHSRYPGVRILGYMTSGGTDGMHFRKAGIPTWAMGGIVMKPNDNFAHGLNERVPIDAFYGALNHWSIIIRNLAGD